MRALTEAQRGLLDTWLGDWRVEADHSWPLQETVVFEIRAGADRLIVKADKTGHHLTREIAAHDILDTVDALAGRVPRRLHADAEARLLVTVYLPGTLVSGTAAEGEPDTYRQAGELLGDLMLPGDISPDYLPRLLEKARRLLDTASGSLVDAPDADRLRARLDFDTIPEIRLYFTHGDFQPRNWLVHCGEVRVIDFGRADWRPWTSEIVRMRHQEFVDRPDLEGAFLSGLARDLDPEDEVALQIEEITQAVGTVVWAHGIGDAEFEEHGRRMIRRILG